MVLFLAILEQEICLLYVPSLKCILNEIKNKINKLCILWFIGDIKQSYLIYYYINFDRYYKLILKIV